MAGCIAGRARPSNRAGIFSAPLDMKTMVLSFAALVVLASSALAERPMLTDREAPRATDLLRAQRLAEQAERRLRLPAAHGGGWKKGGDGWDARGEASSERSGNVVINLD